MGRDISTDVAGLQADVLDHAREFVDVVFQAAPGAYRELLNTPRLAHPEQLDVRAFPALAAGFVVEHYLVDIPFAAFEVYLARFFALAQ